MFKKLKERFHRLGYNRQKRVMNYIEHIQEKIELKNDDDKQIVSEINVLLSDRVKRIEKLQVMAVILYFAIYFSIFSLFFTDILFLSEVVSIIDELISIFGTAVFLIALYFVSSWKELYYQDLNLLSSHLISIYNNQKYTDSAMFDNFNTYKHYIDFFKKRGY